MVHSPHQRDSKRHTSPQKTETNPSHCDAHPSFRSLVGMTPQPKGGLLNPSQTTFALSPSPITCIWMFCMETIVRFLNGVCFEVDARGHKVLCDRLRANGDVDSGMTPPEFSLASLATCAGYYAL